MILTQLSSTDQKPSCALSNQPRLQMCKRSWTRWSVTSRTTACQNLEANTTTKNVDLLDSAQGLIMDAKDLIKMSGGIVKIKTGSSGMAASSCGHPS